MFSSLSISEIEFLPEKVIQLLTSLLEHGILTQEDMIAKGITPSTSSDILGDLNCVRVNLISGRHERPIGAVVTLALSKKGTGAHSVVLEQQSDTIFLRSDGDYTKRDIQLELSERTMHSILVLIDPARISDSIGADAIKHDDDYSDRTPLENEQPPFEYKLLRSIPASSFIKILVSNKIKDHLSSVPHMEIPLSLVPEKNVIANYYDAGSRTVAQVSILAPDFEPEMREILEEHKLVFTHALRAEIPRTREMQGYLQLGEKNEKEGNIDRALFFFDKLLELSPLDVTLHIKMGNLLFRKNTLEDIKGAGRYFAKAIKLNEGLTEAHLKMGTVYKSLALNYGLNREKLLSKAIVCFANALKIEPNNSQLSSEIVEIQALL